MPALTGNELDSDDDMLEVYGDDSLTLDPEQIPVFMDASSSSDGSISSDATNSRRDSQQSRPVYAGPSPPDDAPPPPPPEDGRPPSPLQPTLTQSVPHCIDRLEYHTTAAPLGTPRSLPNPYLANIITRPRAQFLSHSYRWAKYETSIFDNDRLQPFSTARPLPLGF